MRISHLLALLSFILTCHVATGATLTARWSDVWDESQDVTQWTAGGLDFVAVKGPDASAPPRYSGSSKELKIFSTSTITVSCPRVMTEISFDTGTRTQMGFITPSVGEIVEQGTKPLVWRGMASEVTFTVSRYAECASNEGNKYKPGQLCSRGITVETRDGDIEPIDIAPRGGTFDNAVAVAIECPTQGCTLHYRLPDGAEGEIADRGIVTVDCSGILHVTAHIGEQETTADAVFDMVCAQPVFDTEPRSEVPDGSLITVHSPTHGAVMRYTTDSTDPTEASLEVPTEGIAMGWICPVEVRVRAFKDGYSPGPTASAWFYPLGGTPSRLETVIDFTTLGLSDNQSIPSVTDTDGTVTVDLLQGEHKTLPPRFYAKTPAMRLFKGNHMRVTCHDGKLLSVLIHGTATSYRFIGSVEPEGYLINAGPDVTYRSYDPDGQEYAEFTQSPYTSNAARMQTVTVTYIPNVAVTSPSSDDAPLKFYDLMGQLVPIPTRGLYIVKQNGKVWKIRL